MHGVSMKKAQVAVGNLHKGSRLPRRMFASLLALAYSADTPPTPQQSVLERARCPSDRINQRKFGRNCCGMIFECFKTSEHEDRGIAAI